MNFELTEQEQAEVDRARWYISRGMPPPFMSASALLDIIDRATAEPDELDGGAP